MSVNVTVPAALADTPAKSLFVPPVKDLHSAYNAGGYTSTNEEPELINKLLGRHRFNKTAAICSGGEVIMFALLHRSKSVIGVDHAYSALAATVAKLLLLQEFGHKKFEELLTYGKPSEVSDAFSKVRHLLPSVLTKVAYSPAYDISCLRREVHFARPGALQRLEQNLPKLELRHGDLTDIAGDGPFDLLYISNAIEHTGRAGRTMSLAAVAPLVAPGGTVILTTYNANPNNAPAYCHPEFTNIKHLLGFRTTWYFSLFTKNKAKA